MFFKKMKINKYLSKKEVFNTFDLLLKDYVEGIFKKRLARETGVNNFKIEINNLNLDSRKIIIRCKVRGRYKEVIMNEVDIACSDDNEMDFKHYKIDNIEIVYSILIRHFSDK